MYFVNKNDFIISYNSNKYITKQGLSLKCNYHNVTFIINKYDGVFLVDLDNDVYHDIIIQIDNERFLFINEYNLLLFDLCVINYAPINFTIEGDDLFLNDEEIRKSRHVLNYDDFVRMHNLTICVD